MLSLQSNILVKCGVWKTILTICEIQNEFLSNTYPPEVHIDPQQRCAVLNFYSDKMAILPFRQSESIEDAASASKDRSKRLEDDQSRYFDLSFCLGLARLLKHWAHCRWPYAPSYVIDVSEIDSRIRNVIDMVFLHDYYEPTLAILYQSNPTWTG